MDYQFFAFPHPTYVHVRASGANTPANALRFLEEAHAACIARGCDSLLIEQSLDGPSLGAGGIFKLVQSRLDLALRLRRIAYVDTRGRDEGRQFVENMARNRGVNIRAFPTIEDAQRWLES